MRLGGLLVLVLRDSGSGGDGGVSASCMAGGFDEWTAVLLLWPLTAFRLVR